MLSLCLIFLVLVIGLVLSFYGLMPFYRIYSPKKWEIYPINILLKSVGSHDQVIRYGIVRHYFPKVTYNYEVNGRQYTNDKVALDNPSIWKQEEKEACDLLECIVKDKKAYVNTKKSNLSFIIINLTRERKQHYLTILFSGFLLVVVAIVLMATVIN